MLTISDIFNGPPAIAQDALQYALYPPSDLSDRDTVTSLAASILDFVGPLLQDFIWHRDSFELKVVKNPESDGYILQGRMRVGDSIDDEWSVVWLLKQISAKWDDFAISVFDSDGEFLLIEAAEALPAWVEPSNSENRVWIHNSRLHLIPLSYISPPSRRKHRRKLPGRSESDDEDLTVDDNKWISANDAVNVIRDPLIDTFAPEAVERLVWQRISGYPAALKNHVHVTKAWIPVDVAKALTADLSLVQRAVEAFYTRDALQLRSAHRMSRFPPDTSVLRPIKMTRTAYAQLVGQKFFPPKVFGRWQEKEATREWSWRDVGMKIVVGFEMLYQETKARNDAIETAESVKSATDANKDALRRDPHYVKYLQNLAATNYFKGEIQGSKLWQDLENKAASTYINVRREDNASRPSFASQVKLAIAQVSCLPEVPDHEDSKDWLYVDEDFDELLGKTMGVSKAEQKKPLDEMDIDERQDDAEERLASAQATKLKELATKVEKFVEGEGDIEGARFEDEQLSDEEFSDDGDADSEDGEHSDVMMDAQEMTREERQAAMDRLVPALDPSEYGKMPASFHSNSQQVAPDKVEDEETQSTDLNARERHIRPPILQRDKFEGVDSDDETDEEEDDDEPDEEKPQVVGEVEIDMAEEEDDFLEFSRQALGITDEHWNEIILDRKSRGAFLPASAIAKPLKAKEKRPNMSITREEESDKAKASSSAKSGADHKLDSFEAVMKAMDDELARVRNASQKTAPSNSKDKGKALDLSIEEGHDIEAVMEAELKASLERDEDEEGEEITEGGLDYNLIKNFLESFKSQEGLAGPVSSMTGRLQPEWKLPREFGGINTSGVARLTKFYTPLSQSAQTLVQKIFSLICSRPATLCNFLDAPELEEFLGGKSRSDERWTVVYRCYATLFFVFVVDESESALGILDLIQVFVESLDRAFENVCELDLVFHFDEVHHILSELIQGGVVLETNVEEISASVKNATKARKESFTSSNPLSLGVGSGLGPRSVNSVTSLGWLTGKIAGVGTR